MSQTKVQTTGIDDNAVTATQIAAGAVTTDKVAAGAVTSDKMGSGSVSILHGSNAGQSSIQIFLPAGTWFVEFYYTTHIFSSNTIMSMYIEDLVVQTSTNIGDYQGTFYVPMFGGTYVTGNRNITCSIQGAVANPNSSVQRCMVKATRIY